MYFEIYIINYTTDKKYAAIQFHKLQFDYETNWTLIESLPF